MINTVFSFKVIYFYRHNFFCLKQILKDPANKQQDSWIRFLAIYPVPYKFKPKRVQQSVMNTALRLSRPDEISARETEAVVDSCFVLFI